MKYTMGMVLQHKETEEVVTVDGITFYDAPVLKKENGDRFSMYSVLIDEQYTQLQRLWLCLSDGGHNGYFLWDIWEEVGNKEENGAPANFFTDCRDDSRISIQCQHFWTMERAQKYIDSFNQDGWINQHVIRIGE